MADEKKQTLEREYIIPLRKEWRKVANYRRAGRAAKAIKQFIAKHMKVPDRDISKVKLDMYLNNELWFHGLRKPPAKIKVKARKENDIVKVELAEMPAHVKFLQKKHEKRYKPATKPTKAKEEKAEDKPKEEKTEEEKKSEEEKEKAVAEQHSLEAKQEIKAQKHTTAKKEPSFHRMALKK